MSSAESITLTPRAVQMAKQKLADADIPVEGLRLGVKGGGCSGYYYVYDFATKIRPQKDLVFDFDGLKVVVDHRSIEFLKGAVLDWEQSLMSYGFKWKNPNATGDCGCGESFDVGDSGLNPKAV
jgi:iron-sulfur cluster assembly protein